MKRNTSAEKGSHVVEDEVVAKEEVAKQSSQNIPVLDLDKCDDELEVVEGNPLQ